MKHRQIVKVAPESADSYAPPRFFRMMTRYRDAIDSMSNEAAGEALKSLLALADSGSFIEPESEAAKLAVEFIRPDIEADIERSRKTSAARRAACQSRWSREAAK